jgi:hypothetical protein
MEEAMFKCLATVTGALVLVSSAMLIAERAEAGASASAPSKYSQASHLAAQQAQTNRQAGRNGFGITEYSSSSARKSSH